MARHKKYEKAEDVQPGLDISSLIDVTFLLLIYFLVTSTIMPRETDLGMALPSAMPTEEQPDLEPMFIRIDSTGAIYSGTGPSQMVLDTDVDDRTVPLLSSQLDAYRAAARAANSKPLVQIFADGGTNQQRVIDVLNALAGADVTSVTFTDLLDP